MARAYVDWFSQAEYDPSSGKDKITLSMTFTGAEVPSGYEIAFGEVLFDAGDPASQLRSKITAIVQVEASARGYIVTKQDMCIPAVQQGI